MKYHGLARRYLVPLRFTDAAATERRYVGRATGQISAPHGLSHVDRTARTLLSSPNLVPCRTMTVPRFGRITPIQGHLLGLAGFQLSRAGARIPEDDSELADTMRDALRELRRLCAADFGCNLVAWREYLMCPEAKHLGYAREPGFGELDEAIIAAASDSRRKRVVIGFLCNT